MIMKFLLLVLLLILSAYSVDNNMEMAKRNILKDYSRAFSLYKTEAESGDEKAQYNIGYMYSQGLELIKILKELLNIQNYLLNNHILLLYGI